jgi:hypothetical protein
VTPVNRELLTTPVRAILRTVGRRALQQTSTDRFGAGRIRFQLVVETFVGGYEAALSTPDIDEVAASLRGLPPTFRGFAYEGAAMALQLLDLLLPGRRDRVSRFVGGPAAPFTYLAHVGAGWAAARLHCPPSVVLSRLDPLLGWLAVDGYGFHEGFFHTERVIARRQVPWRLTGYTLRAFDHGVGRSLWFNDGADAARIAASVERFALERRGDLWSGVGLAASYAGGVGIDVLHRLRHEARGYEREMAQGAAFAVAARERADNADQHTDEACEVFTGASSGHVAGLVRALQPREVDGDGAAAYERWRTQVRLSLAPTEESTRTKVAV